MSRPRRYQKDSPIPYRGRASDQTWRLHDETGAGVPCDLETEIGTIYLCGACRGWFAPASKCKGCDFCIRCHAAGQPTSGNKHEFTPFGRYCANRSGDKYRGQQEARPSYRDYRGTAQETTRRKSYADAAAAKGTGYNAPDDEDDIKSIETTLDNEAEDAMMTAMANAKASLAKSENIVPETPQPTVAEAPVMEQ